MQRAKDSTILEARLIGQSAFPTGLINQLLLPGLFWLPLPLGIGLYTSRISLKEKVLRWKIGSIKIGIFTNDTASNRRKPRKNR
jgi:hypothetical protein